MTLTWPGYWSVSSIFLTMSRASRIACQVVDLFGLDDDAHFAAGLDGERLLDAVERVGDFFERFQPPHVVLDALAPRAGPAPEAASAAWTSTSSIDWRSGSWSWWPIDRLDDRLGLRQSDG